MNCQCVVAVAALGLALSGCATVIEGADQTLRVTTPPVVGAECIISGPTGSYHVTTPASVTIPRTQRDLHVECDKVGYEPAWATVQSHFNGATLGNVLAGGLIGVGVDATTGANYTFPTNIPLPMDPMKGPPAPALTPTVAAETTAKPMS
ncbi:MAG: hypothetical protein JWM91_2041 [Rhodospirillales bacterium]|nr:hypothetical protein [Rhodospirillales bacterium]